jgi:hypothetical protein
MPAFVFLNASGFIKLSNYDLIMYKKRNINTIHFLTFKYTRIIVNVLFLNVLCSKVMRFYGSRTTTNRSFWVKNPWSKQNYGAMIFALETITVKLLFLIYLFTIKHTILRSSQDDEQISTRFFWSDSRRAPKI